MKVEIDGKTYCVETLIFDNKRLRKEVVEGAKLHRLVLDKIRAEIANHLQIMDICDVKKVNGVIVQSELINRKVVLYDSVMQIIDKYRNEVNHEVS